MKQLPKHKELILFDGICNLCNASVQFIIKHDTKNHFIFASLQSKTGKEIVKLNQVDTNLIDSVILYSPTKGIYHQSTAALKIASKLNFPTNLLSLFLIVPPFIRNWLYGFIAKNRYKWFGTTDACLLPTEELKNKFLD